MCVCLMDVVLSLLRSSHLALSAHPGSAAAASTGSCRYPGAHHAQPSTGQAHKPHHSFCRRLPAPEPSIRWGCKSLTTSFRSMASFGLVQPWFWVYSLDYSNHQMFFSLSMLTMHRNNLISHILHVKAKEVVPTSVVHWICLVPA